MERSTSPECDSTERAVLTASQPTRSPITVIEATSRWPGVNLNEIYNYRELLYFLAWRDIKVRYKQAALGVMWIIFQPLLTAMILAVALGRTFGSHTQGIPYTLFLYIALLPWTFFSNSVSSCAACLIGGTNLITKIYFPRLILPGSTVVACIADFMISFIFTGLFTAYYRISPTWNLLLLLALAPLTLLFTLGVGILLSAVSVCFRDVRFILPFVVQIWMFASPIIYPVSIVPEQWRWLYDINPLVGIIEGYRSAMLGLPVPIHSLLLACATTALILIGATSVFRRLEKNFADII